jgi:hypothetical protein
MKHLSIRTLKTLPTTVAMSAYWSRDCGAVLHGNNNGNTFIQPESLATRVLEGDGYST